MFNTIPDNQNPIFSSYSRKDPEFNENMDEYVKAPNDIYIEEQKKAAQKIKRNVNADALDNIPEVPDFLQEQYKEVNKLPEIYNRLNVVSRQEIEDWQRQGKMGIAETWAKKKKWEMTPFAGTTAEATIAVRNANTLRKIKEGKEVSDVEMELLVDQLRDMKELEVRGRTIGGGAVDIAMTSIPYAIEFGAALATLPEGVGAAAFAKALSQIGAKKAAQKAVQTALKEAAVKSAMTGAKKAVPLSAAKSLYRATQKEFLNQGIEKAAIKGAAEIGAKATLKTAAKAAPKALASAAIANTVVMPQHFIGSAADRQLSTGVYVTDAGDGVFTDSENLAVSIMKAFGETTLDAFTETAGWMFAPVTRYFAKPVRNILPKKFFTEFEKLATSRFGMPVSDVFRKYGYDGVIEEMGEEQLSRLLCQVFGINSDNISDYFNFDSFMDNVFYFDKQGKSGVEGLSSGLKSAAQGYGQEALSFGGMSLGGHAVMGSVDSGVKVWEKRKGNQQIKELTDKANQRLYSPEQFYLDQGFIKIKGSQSLAEQKLREIWTKENVPEGLQDSFMEAIPIVGTWAKGADDKSIRAIKEKIENGEQITQSQLDWFNRFREREYEKQIRGYTIGGQIGASVMPSLLAFGTEIALGGAMLKAIGLAGKGLALGTATEKLAKSAGVSGKLAKGAGTAIGYTTEGALSGAVGEAVNPQRLFATYQERRLNDEMKITDRGTVIFTEASESPATAFIKSMQQVFLSYFTEGMGPLISAGLIRPAGKVLKYAAVNPATKKIASTGAQQFARVIGHCPQLDSFIKKTAPILARAYEKLNGLPIKGTSAEWLKSTVKFDGFLEEMGEEVLEDLLNLTLGTDNQERSLENYVNTVFKSPEEWAVLAGTIALQGTTISVTGNLLGTAMQNNGVPEEKIIEVLLNSTEAEKAELIDGLIKNNSIQLDDITPDVEAVKTDFKNDMLSQGVSESNAEFAAKLYTALQITRADRTGRSVEELYNEDKLRVEQIDNPEAYFQSAGINKNSYLQNNGKKAIDNFYTKHSQHIEAEPEKYTGSRKIKDVLKFLGSKDGKKAVIKTPAGDVTITKSNVNHLTKDNETERLGNLNKVVSTLKNPNIIININENNNDYNYYIKAFKREKQNKVHTQIIKLKSDGNFYVTNFDLRNNKFEKLLKQGQIIYDSTLYTTAPTENNSVPVNNSITDNGGKINPNVKNGNTYFQSAQTAGAENNRTAIAKKEWEEKGTESRFFKKWFGNSKVVDENGKPLVVYHTGTFNDVYDLNQSRSYNGVVDYELPGIYTTPSYENSVQYGTPDQVKALYVSIQNPYRGDDIYELRKKLGTYRKVMDYLKKQGYDGVIENEGTDEAEYIAFSPEQIKSVDNQGTFDSSNPNIYFQEVNEGENDNAAVIPVNIDKDSVPNFNTINELKNWIYENLALLGTVNIKSNNRDVQFSKTNIARSMKAPNRSSAKRNSYAGLKELVENSIFGGEIKADEKHKYKVKGQELYYNAFTYNGEIYGVEISVDVPKQESSPYGYAGHKIKIIKAASAASGIGSNELTSNSPDTSIIIHDIKKLFNPNVNNGEDKTSFQGGEDAVQVNMLHDNITPLKLHKIKGAYLPAENFIELFKTADESTIVHEFAHWYLTRLIEDAKYHEASADDLAAVRKFVKNDGGDFTREQHEKFARGFEAYIRSGWARTNRLKKIFEDFKNALLQIYDTITQIIYTEEGVDKPFTEEDLPQINSLFERILSTENERIQATVFDKVNEIEDKIRKIKEVEVKEFEELDTIYQDNIAALNRKSDKKRQVEEYLALADKAAKREPKELREYKARYKDAVLSILSVATGYDKRYIANPRSWEQVQTALEHADDKITTEGGLRPEWREFFADTGVSYENDEIDGDYKLAEQAFNILTSGSYNKSAYDTAEFEEIEQFTGKFDYLYNKVKSLKGEEKETAFEALAQLFSNIPDMPESVIEEFANRLITIGDEFEEDQKADFNRKRYPNMPVVQQLQWYITSKLNSLKVYNPDTRYKMRLDKSHGLYRQIKNATSVNNAKRIVKKINNFIIEDMRNNQRAILHKEIQKQIKINSKHVKSGSIKKGRFDWRTNTAFAELVKMNKLSQEDAQKEMGTLLKINEIEAGEERIDWRDDTSDMAETMQTDFQENLKRKFLQYKSSRMRELDVQHTSSLLEDILKLKFEGRRAKTEEEFKKQTERVDYRNNLISILDNNKNNNIAKFGTNWIVKSGTLGNWESLLNAVFDSETAKKYSLQALEAQVEAFSRKKTLELINKACKIYRFKTSGKFSKIMDYDNAQPLFKLLQNYDNEVYNSYKEVTFNKETGEFAETPLSISKAQIMTLYIWSLNHELLQRLNNQYGIEALEDMFSKLSEQDKAFCLEFINICDSMYELINEVYINTYGLSLPKVENYFPSVTERIGSDLDMFHDFIVKSSNPSFIKVRKNCSRIPMKPKNPLEILLPHINKTANYIIMSETVNFYNKIFKETPLNKKILEVYGQKDGDKIIRALQNQLSASIFSTVAKGNSFAHEFMDNIATNYISASIGLSPKIMIGQLLSVINYAENMPVHEWAKGFAKAIADPKQTYNFMMNCEYLQTRLAKNTQNEMIATITGETDRFRTLKNFCTLNTKWGDIFAIIFGGKPYVDYLMSQGMSKEEAFKKFVDDTLRAQQAGLPSTTSEWQKAQTKTAMGRMFFAFQNTSLQYERKVIDSLIKLSKGDISGQQFAKTFMIYKILNPIMFTSFLQNLSLIELVSALTGGYDPDKALAQFGTDILLAILCASLGAYGLAGFVAIQLIRYGAALVQKKIFHEKPHVFESSTPLLSDVDNVCKKFMKNDVTLADYVYAATIIGKYATGAPVDKVVNMAEGVGDIVQGNGAIGTLRVLGNGEYKAAEAITGKPPKNRKE